MTSRMIVRIKSTRTLPINKPEFLIWTSFSIMLPKLRRKESKITELILPKIMNTVTFQII
jgi:hypothetical protein